MRWESWSDFWAMGGYAVYVWGSVGVTAALMAIEVWQARQARRQALQQVRAQMDLDGWTDDKDVNA
jgi:heme exporter protein D